MRLTGKVIAGLLVALGFGGTVGFVSGCSASRVQRSRGADDNPTTDTVIVPGGNVPVRVMYGSPPARFDPNRNVPVRPEIP